MEKKFKVGQRIELYKVLTDGNYDEGDFKPGTVRPELGELSSPGAVRVLSNHSGLEIGLAMFKDDEVMNIGAVTITAVKCHGCGCKLNQSYELYAHEIDGVYMCSDCLPF